MLLYLALEFTLLQRVFRGLLQLLIQSLQPLRTSGQIALLTRLRVPRKLKPDLVFSNVQDTTPKFFFASNAYQDRIVNHVGISCGFPYLTLNDDINKRCQRGQFIAIEIRTNSLDRFLWMLSQPIYRCGCSTWRGAYRKRCTVLQQKTLQE